MKRFCAGWCAVALLGGAQWAWGQEGLFERLDANKDGVVEAEEVEGEDRKELFNRLLQRNDKDGDKKLTKEEFAAGTQRAEGDRPAADRPRDGAPRTDRPRDGEPRPDQPRDGEPRPDRPRAGQPRDGQPREGRPDGFRPQVDLRQIAEDRFREWDANGDGKLTAEEVPERMRERFNAAISRLELDETGVTREQFGRVSFALFAPVPIPLTLLRALDGDGDGELSKEEIEGSAKALATLDKNEDGKLTREELSPPGPGGIPGGFPGRPGFGRPDQPRPDGRPERRPDGRPDGRGRDGRPEIQQFLDRLMAMDTNGDKKIGKDEAQGRIKENFDSFDANRDGSIDADELRARFPTRRPEGDRPDRRPEGGRREGRRPPTESEEKPADKE